jgi:NADH:ubiquinone oxidoreductase subunit 6 (subunit J)
MVRWIVIFLMVIAVLVVFTVAVLLARLIGQAAEQRGRNGRIFFWVSFLLFPIGALICWLLVLATARPETRP